ncbi:3-dehydroquinate synthase [Nibribacter ruber]|uniref:3-dehydroquinate synthase n=1 Tax=Nibribacter ruber TaxID=2698458 RepID=A0A6P1NY92_9BACT|nr:3-dehydroquinate synthase [Nibribacter ruber]QHL87189.1 3-dehydroquinate synthase [Nibribacter ruber]
MTEEIFIGKDALTQAQSLLANKAYKTVVVLVDENTFVHCYPLLKSHLPESHHVVQIPSGEENKTLATCEHVWRELTNLHLDRWSLVVNLGGGVLTDLGGFCASLYKRGIRFVNVPTTLLAQVDASVGGKTGIDFMGFKNHLGVFREPVAVLVNPDFLHTLDLRQIKSGYAEIIKHWLIADAEMFKAQRYIGLFTEDWTPLIEHSIKIKSRIVTADPLENDLRKVLNFGHTIGHAVESYFLEKPGQMLLHGEAIAVGMLCEAWLSVQKGLLSPEELDQIETFLHSIYEKVPLQESGLAAISQLCLHDKKNSGATINCTLLERIGMAVYDQPITLQEVQSALRYYQLL